MVELGSAGILRPGTLRPLRALAWTVLLGAILILSYNLAAKAVGLLLVTGAAPSAAGRLAASAIGCIVMVLAYWGAVRLAERRKAAELSLSPADLALGGVIGAAAIAAVIAVQWLLGWVVIGPRSIDAVALALRDSLRAGVVEEFLLRLVIFRLLWRAFGIWPAIVAAATLFGLLHLANPDSSLFAAACLIAGEGIAIGLYLLTGRIWASVAMHAAWNFTQGWIFGATVSGMDEIAGGPLTLKPAAGVPPLLSGGGFGPEASLAALVVSLIGSVLILRWAYVTGKFRPADEAELQATNNPA